MTLGKFQRPTGTGAAPAKKKSRYAGIQAAQPRDPMPHAGAYRFKVLECSEGNNPGKGTDSFKAKLEIVAIYDDVSEHRVGQTVAFIQLLSGKGGPAGLARTKAFVMGAAGYDDEAEYDAFDPDGEFIDACTGAQNQYATDGYTIVGRLVDCQVLRGNATADGTDYYRDFAWCPVPEAEQAGA
jgi:hypothetical protein